MCGILGALFCYLGKLISLPSCNIRERTNCHTMYCAELYKSGCLTGRQPLVKSE